MNTTEQEDIIEDVTEEQLIANEELEQDTPEEVSEEQEATFDDSIKSILLGEKKKYKKEEEDEDDYDDDEEDDDEDMDEMEYGDKDMKKKEKKESVKSKKESEESEDDDMEEMEHGDKDMKKKKKEESKKKVSEALDLLLQNEADLSEDFKTEATTLFEATIAERSVEIQEKLEEKYNSQLNEEVESIRENLIERIDDYLSYVVESWMDENTEQVENTLRTQIAENFITSLKDVFVENYIEVPAEKQDLVEELSNVAEESNEKLAQAETEIASLQERVQEFERASVIADLSEDLTETELHKFKSILEGVEFNSKESFKKKASVIKGSIFEGLESKTTNTEEEYYSSEDTEIIIEGEEDAKEKIPAHMRMYVDALSRK